jgi:single-strand DNA-binding protein
MNKVILYGRTTRELDLKYAPESGYAYLFNSIAVERYDGKNKKKVTDFFNIVISGKNAENIATYSKKGGRIIINGYLRNSSYEKNGEKRTSTEVVVEHLKLVDVYKIDNKGVSDINDLELIDEEVPEVFKEELDFLSR